MHQLLCEVWLLVRWHDEIIDEDVIHERSAHRAGIAQVVDLNGSRTKRQDLWTCTLCVTLEIHQDVNLVGSNPLRRLCKGHVPQVREPIKGLHQVAAALGCRHPDRRNSPE